MTTQNAQHLRRDFSRQAPHYAEQATLQYAVAERLAALAGPYCTKQSKLLDVGAGTGFVAQLLPVSPQQLVQLDCAQGMSKINRAHGSCITADMHDIPLKDNSFNIIMSSLAMQWSSALSRAMQEAKRCLIPGGYYIFSTLCEETLDILPGLFPQQERLLHFLPPQTYFQALTSAGFELVQRTQEKRETQHESQAALLQHIKSIGAGNKAPARRVPLSKTHYAALLKSAPITAQWQVLYVVARKP